MSITSDEHKIQLVVTGGTIDSFYDTDQCTTVCHDETAIPDFLLNLPILPPMSMSCLRLA